MMDMRRLQLILTTLFLALPISAWSAELVMLEQDGCVWCQKWHAEIGSIYPKTEEAARAPLRVIDINKNITSDLNNIRIERFYHDIYSGLIWQGTGPDQRLSW